MNRRNLILPILAGVLCLSSFVRFSLDRRKADNNHKFSYCKPYPRNFLTDHGFKVL